jgi:hypothetical protein
VSCFWLASGLVQKSQQLATFSLDDTELPGRRPRKKYNPKKVYVILFVMCSTHFKLSTQQWKSIGLHITNVYKYCQLCRRPKSTRRRWPAAAAASAARTRSQLKSGMQQFFFRSTTTPVMQRKNRVFIFQFAFCTNGIHLVGSVCAS